MASEDYIKAQKMGLKAYKTSIVRGEYPYLPVLDEILSHGDIEGEERIGICDIPLDQVVGTSTFGRTQAFASNFMPLLKPGSEFSAKWSSLCDAQLEEGIHDAIKVYEYLNKYYVVEGNKRVSVMKYFDAPTIMADVTRKIPRRSEEPENRIYHEYMDFYDLTQINNVTFSKVGSYTNLLAALGKDHKTVWTTEERQKFASFFAVFSKFYLKRGGEKLRNVTSGDALLLYLTFYPYGEVREATDAEVRENIEKIWPEILLLGEEDSVELSMDPIQERTTMGSVISMIMPPKQKVVAFVYDKEPEASEWIYGHELGRLHLLDVFGDALDIRKYIVDLNAGNEEAQLEEICRDGCDIIFTVTSKLLKACLQTAIEYPDIVILNCSLNSSYNTVRTYYTRMYEAKFLTGMIAGAMCTNDKVGYRAAYPLYGEAASINAFAMGAKMVNPNAKVYLTWSTMKDFDADKYFLENDITYISAQNMITPQDEKRQFGFYEETPEGKRNLAMPIYDWGVFYEKLINSILRGTWKSEGSDMNKAINYWWGLSAGVIDVICSNKLPSGTVKLVELMKKAISDGLFQPFTGPLVDQEGIVHYEDDEVVKPEDIMTMDWLVENVVGRIPTVDELKEEARPLVMLRGLHSATAEMEGKLGV